MKSVFFLFIPLIITSMLLTACHTATKSNTLAPDEQSTVTGKWVGTWWYEGKMNEGQPLLCTCQQIGPNQWTATFDAQYGQRTLYTFDITGKQVGSAVLFEGAVDLGAEQGGIYNWQGEAIGDTFNGKYQSQQAQGGFQMKKVQESQ